MNQWLPARGRRDQHVGVLARLAGRRYRGHPEIGAPGPHGRGQPRRAVPAAAPDPDLGNGQFTGRGEDLQVCLDAGAQNTENSGVGARERPRGERAGGADVGEVMLVVEHRAHVSGLGVEHRYDPGSGRAAAARPGPIWAVRPERNVRYDHGRTRRLLDELRVRYPAPDRAWLRDYFAGSIAQGGIGDHDRSANMTEDRIAIVTGASPGIGRETAARLPGHGTRVVATARRKTPLTALAAEALRQEVCGYGIRVTLIERGFVRSGFQRAAGYDPVWFAAVTEDNVRCWCRTTSPRWWRFVVGQRAHVHLDDIRIRPTRQKA